MITGKQTLAGFLMTAAFFLSACSSQKASDSTFRIVLTNAAEQEKQQFTDDVEFLQEKEAGAVELLRKGQADCAYGQVSGENAIHYGILKSGVINRRELCLLSKIQLQASGDLEGLTAGYPEELEEEFVGYLRAVPELELHAYRSEQQLQTDLDAGLLDLAAVEIETAFALLETLPDNWKLNQPTDLPVLEYRFFACSQEALDQAVVFRKEN